MTSIDKELNIYLDAGPKYIHTPSGKDVLPSSDPLDFTDRLNQIDTPYSRLLIFINNCFDITNPYVTPEAGFVRIMALSGALGGMTYGGIMNNQMIRERFIRKHNKAAFDGQHIAQRKYHDYLVSRTLSRGFKYGVHGAILTGSAGMIAFSSIIYRDRIYAPDWLLGFAAFGTLHRFTLGPKAWIFGAGAGTVAGMIALGLAYTIEFVGGTSVSQLRYLNHTDWLRKRYHTYDMMRIMSEKAIDQRYKEMEDSDKTMREG